MNPVLEQQKKELELEEICKEILGNSRNELYLSMRFLDVALSSLRFIRDEKVRPAATDGCCLYYHPEGLTGLYRRSRVCINRLYLHTVFHCLFGHLYHRKGRDTSCWNLACDIAVEYLIDGLDKRCLHTGKSSLRRIWYEKLRQQNRVVTAEMVYRFLRSRNPGPEALAKLTMEFFADDHSLWEQPGKQPNQEPKRNWEDIRERMQTEMETFAKEAAQGDGNLLEQIRLENREKYDYREFLRRFSVLHEEMQVDMDSFDYIYYHYGLKTYGNMPLIEPLETREEHRVEDFVLVIDTSMSCKGELVRRFLEETYGILSESESFFRKINVHILQCDECVQEDYKITNSREMKNYMEHFTLKGGGGTDFRPAFAYVEKLIAGGSFTRLKGLIYFTDGYGIFPAKKPAYETAFIFMKEDYRDVDVPAWAIKLIIDPADEEETGR